MGDWAVVGEEEQQAHRAGEKNHQDYSYVHMDGRAIKEGAGLIMTKSWERNFQRAFFFFMLTIWIHVDA